MNGISLRRVAKLLLVVPAAMAGAQTLQQTGTLTIAGQPDQAALLRINGKQYVDIESLARITHGSIQFKGTQTILTLPQPASVAPLSETQARDQAAATFGGFLSAEIEALGQIREWRASLVNAIQNNYPVTEGWVGKLRRSTDGKLQLAIAATTTEPDRESLELLRNEYTNMQQMSDQFLAMQAKANLHFAGLVRQQFA